MTYVRKKSLITLSFLDTCIVFAPQINHGFHTQPNIHFHLYFVVMAMTLNPFLLYAWIAIRTREHVTLQPTKLPFHVLKRVLLLRRYDIFYYI